MSDDYEDTLYGLVMPWGRDEDDQQRYMLVVYGEEEFLIEKGKMANELAQHVDRWVTVDGRIKEFEEYSSIKVYRYDFEDEAMGYDDDNW